MEPGRIPPIQKAGAGAGGQSVSKIAENPKGAIVEGAASKVPAGVTKYFGDKDNQNRYRRALSKAHSTERAPLLPQYRISLFEGGIFIVISACVDICDFIIGLLDEFVVPEAIVIIIDFIYGVLVFAYARFRLKMPVSSHLMVYFSILAAEFVGDIPLINAFWWLDAWYIVHSVRAEDRQIHAQLMQTIEEERQEKARQDFMENFTRQQAEAAAGGNDEG
jgi:hypothetical protein